MQYGDIRFYDENFTLLYIAPRYISVNWQLKFREYGTVEIHLEKSAETVELLTAHKYLFIEQDDWQAVVTGIKIDTDCAVFARTPEWLLTKFWISDFSAEEALENELLSATTAASVACCLVREGIPDSVSLLTEDEDSDDTDCASFAVTEATDLYSAVRNCLTDEKTGFSFSFDTESKGFVFCVCRGKENTDVVLSDEYKTSYDGSYTFDLQREASGGVYYQRVTNGGRWDPDANEPELKIDPKNYGMYYTASAAGKGVGLIVEEGDILLCSNKNGRFKIVEEAKPFPVVFEPEERGIFSWCAVLSSDTEDAATRELKSLKAESTVSCKTKKLVYKTDFYLGDIIRTQFVSGDFVFLVKQIISGVHIWDDAQEFGCIPEATQLTEET